MVIIAIREETARIAIGTPWARAYAIPTHQRLGRERHQLRSTAAAASTSYDPAAMRTQLAWLG